MEPPDDEIRCFEDGYVFLKEQNKTRVNLAPNVVLAAGTAWRTAEDHTTETLPRAGAVQSINIIINSRVAVTWRRDDPNTYLGGSHILRELQDGGKRKRQCLSALKKHTRYRFWCEGPFGYVAGADEHPLPLPIVHALTPDGLIPEGDSDSWLNCFDSAYVARRAEDVAETYVSTLLSGHMEHGWDSAAIDLKDAPWTDEHIALRVETIARNAAAVMHKHRPPDLHTLLAMMDMVSTPHKYRDFIQTCHPDRYAAMWQLSDLSKINMQLCGGHILDNRPVFGPHVYRELFTSTAHDGLLYALRVKT